MKLPSVEKLLKSGCHFGHQPAKTHPKMKKYIFGSRKGIQIIDLDQTVKYLEEACNYVTDLVAKGGTIIFVSTKPQVKAFMKEAAISVNMPYITERWIGGLFTNYKHVSTLSKKRKELDRKLSSIDANKYTKKEQVMMKKEYDKLEKLVGGLENMRQLPDAMFVIDVKNDKTAVVEASKKEIPIVAVCDTNNKPVLVDYIIPSNDDAVQSIEIMVKTITEAVREGQAKRKTTTKVVTKR